MILGFGFPNPIGWAIDKITGLIGGAVTAGFAALIGGLVAWVIDAVVWIVGGVFNFFLTSTDPNVQADWFVTGTGPYATTVGIGASLLLLFLLAGIVQGVLKGDVGGMLRGLALDLPVSVLGMIGLVTVTQALIRLTDVLSGHLVGNFQKDISKFGAVVATLSHLSGGISTAFVVFVLGLVAVLAGLVLVAELVIRSALIYIVVAMAPLVFAARLWPALRGVARKLLELLCALILSKLVIGIALSVAAAAAVGSGSGGEVTSLPPPEVFAQHPGGSVTQAVGILLTAAAAFGVAAFSPLLIAKLMPLTEAAVVAQGLRGGPVRAGQQGLMMANTMQMVSGRRLNHMAAGKTGGKAIAAAEAAGGPAPNGARTSAGNGPTAAGAPGGPAGVAAGAKARAGRAVKGAGTTGARAATAVAEEGMPSSPAGPPSQRSPAEGRRSPPSARGHADAPGPPEGSTGSNDG